MLFHCSTSKRYIESNSGGPPGFEPGSIAPLGSIVAGVAREVRGCLVRGEGDRVDVLLTLLEALRGEPA
jgi:hypothetical protein